MDPNFIFLNFSFYSVKGKAKYDTCAMGHTACYIELTELKFRNYNLMNPPLIP